MTPRIGPATQQTSSAAPNVVYVPRNVYVPVIKPVFVPRERKLSIMMIVLQKETFDSFFCY